MAIFQPRREASGEANPADTLILDSSLQNAEKINFCCLSHPVRGSLLWQLALTNTLTYILMNPALRINETGYVRVPCEMSNVC